VIEWRNSRLVIIWRNVNISIEKIWDIFGGIYDVNIYNNLLKSMIYGFYSIELDPPYFT